MTVTFIICPANLVTGGPELLHQLSSTLQGNGCPSKIIYYPFDSGNDVPESYKKYNVSRASINDVKTDDAVVIPEVFTHLVSRFATNRVFLWWLSVDNFHSSRAANRIDALIPSTLQSVLKMLVKPLPVIRRIQSWVGRAGGLRDLSEVHLHLYQSEYARTFLDQNALVPNAPLGDYINEEYLDFINRPPSLPRENFMAFNPAKGADRTDAIIRELADRNIDVIPMPIRGYSREGVRDLLARSKVYIDFGHHPGKDRIPREAAAMGACVIVNRRGSAGNSIDVPFPDSYKVNDEAADFAQDAANKIEAILKDYTFHVQQFDSYRTAIAQERRQFVEQALQIFI